MNGAEENIYFREENWYFYILGAKVYFLNPSYQILHNDFISMGLFMCLVSEESFFH